jgi:hypothetical protein
MEFSGALRVEYWAEKKADTNELLDLEGIDEFRAELTKHYIGPIHARPGPCGGLYGLVVEFLSSFSLQHFVNLTLDGIAYDLIKSGSDALVLRPFVAAYDALKRKNAKHRVHIDRLLLSFQDSLVIIHNIGEDTIVDNLEPILRTVATSYSHLILRTGEKPFSISIPIFEDTSEERLCRFRELLDVDETIRDVSDKDYLKLWGIQYDYLGTTRVFDVSKGVLLDEEFYSQSMYWWAWKNRRDRIGKSL